MASFVINNVGLTQKWSWFNDPDSYYSFCTMPSGTPADPNGHRRQLITQIAVAIAGNGGTKTYSVFAMDTNGGDRHTSVNYSVGAGSAASLQPARSLTSGKGANAGQAQLIGFNQVTSAILVGRGEMASTSVSTEGPAGLGWPGYSLYAVVYYATLPSAPGTPSLSSSPSAPGSITASWAAPGNTGDSAITSYRLQYSVNSNFSGASTVTTSNRSVTLTGLAQGTRYYFRVVAINGVASLWGTTSAWSGTNSIVAAANPVQAALATFTPPQGSYVATVTVALASATPGATLYYTTNGTTPTTGSTVYSTPLVLTTTTTVKVLVVAGGYSNSDIATAVYTIVRIRRSNGSTWSNVLGLQESDGSAWVSPAVYASNGTSWVNPA